MANYVAQYYVNKNSLNPERPKFTINVDNDNDARIAAKEERDRLWKEQGVWHVSLDSLVKIEQVPLY